MSSLNRTYASQKPVEIVHPDHLPSKSKHPKVVASALETLVKRSEKYEDVRLGIHAPMHRLFSLPKVTKLIPGIEKLANEYHIGNFVEIRGTGERFFESMPIYTRLGMHLLFYGGTQVKILHSRTVETTLKDLSIRVCCAGYITSQKRILTRICSKARSMIRANPRRIFHLSSIHTEYRRTTYYSQTSASIVPSTSSSTVNSSLALVPCRMKPTRGTRVAQLTAGLPCTLLSTSQGGSGSRATISLFRHCLVSIHIQGSPRLSLMQVLRLSVFRLRIITVSTARSML